VAEGGSVFATIDPPEVISPRTTTVPPFSSRLENGRLYGRSSCDAKGILAAQLAATEQLGER
jgi:acetylornithine deacetylase